MSPAPSQFVRLRLLNQSRRPGRRFERLINQRGDAFVVSDLHYEALARLVFEPDHDRLVGQKVAGVIEPDPRLGNAASAPTKDPRPPQLSLDLRTRLGSLYVLEGNPHGEYEHRSGGPLADIDN